MLEWPKGRSFASFSVTILAPVICLAMIPYCIHRTASFSGVVPMSALLYEPFYQLLRLRLLADRMVTDGELGIPEAKVVVVVPEDNLAYREQITSPPLARQFPHLYTVADVMRATLKQPDTSFASVCPSLLLEAVEQACGAAAALWAAYCRERYG